MRLQKKNGRLVNYRDTLQTFVELIWKYFTFSNAKYSY